MAVITDEMMQERRKQAASYCLVILKKAAGYGSEGSGKIIWEHGRRNISGLGAPAGVTFRSRGPLVARKRACMA